VPTNPLIELGRDPVAFLAWSGYALLMTTVVGLGVAFTLRKGATQIALAARANRQRSWWGEAFDGWLPPASWIGWTAVILLVWVVIVWALGALVWVIQ